MLAALPCAVLQPEVADASCLAGLWWSRVVQRGDTSLPHGWGGKPRKPPPLQVTQA